LIGAGKRPTQNLLPKEDRQKARGNGSPSREWLGVYVLGGLATGSTILDIVPADARLQVEARIPAKNIGNVVVGQPVVVKVATYDYTRYGSIPGGHRHPVAVIVPG
jgi:multidrug efflux pump subunit AcrA (membrane-fusion protein)